MQQFYKFITWRFVSLVTNNAATTTLQGKTRRC